MSRLRANQITNQSADGAPTVQNGLIVTGVCTATTFKGDGSQLTGVVQSDTPIGNSVASTTFYETDDAVSISTTTTLTRTSSNPGKIYTKFQEVVVGTSSPGSVALVVGAGEELVVDAYGLRTPDNI